MTQIAAEAGWSWEVQLVSDPDPLLAETDQIIATADSVILDSCRRWFNLARWVIDHQVPDAHVVNLSRTETES
jgi:hypothetical protein